MRHFQSKVVVFVQKCKVNTDNELFSTLTEVLSFPKPSHMQGLGSFVSYIQSPYANTLLQEAILLNFSHRDCAKILQQRPFSKMHLFIHLDQATLEACYRTTNKRAVTSNKGALKSSVTFLHARQTAQTTAK